jgi:hypothetical protein
MQATRLIGRGTGDGNRVDATFFEGIIDQATGSTFLEKAGRFI